MGQMQGAQARPMPMCGVTRPMPIDGVIGGPGGATPGKSAVGRGPVQRVNPVGGVIGNSAGRGNSSSAQALSAVPGRNSRRGKTDAALVWDPDNPWETTEGVAPVVLPVPEQRVDPGPAIGLD